MKVVSCSTHVIQPGEDLLKILDRHVPFLEEGSILAITSKILSVCQNRIVADPSIQKNDLIKQEADAFLEIEGDVHNRLLLTIKHGLLMPAAGIDESNCEEGYILYPENMQADAEQIWKYLRQTRKLRELGIIITDSRTTPLRRGVTGVALAWCGFVPLYNYVGKPDLFGKPLKVTFCNVVDALAAAAVLAMGEGDEQTPMALITEAPKVVFLDRVPSEEEKEFLSVSIEEDLYSPLLKAVRWKGKTSS